MRNLLTWILVVLLSATLWAQTARPQATTKAKPRTRTRAQQPTSTTAAEIQTLRQALDSQQQQIQQLRDQLQQRDAALQRVQQQLNTLQSSAAQANSTAQKAASTSEQNATAVSQVQITVAELKKTTAAGSNPVQKEEKRLADLEQPAAIRYRGVTITPGGFVDANAIYRTHNTNSDVSDSFGTIPFSGAGNSHLSELRFSSRHSNISLMAEGNIEGMKATGYWEVDFLGAAPTASEVQTNAFTPRLREFWANLESKSGFSFLGGQSWSLITSNRKGIRPKNEFRPATVDASYAVGFHYARETTFRVAKNFSKGAVAFAVENPETVVGGTLPSGLTVLWRADLGTVSTPGSGFASTAAGPSLDAAPDLVGKVAFDSSWGHFEVGAIGRFFRDRVITAPNVPNGGKNNVTAGGGVVVNMILPVVPKKADIVLATLTGAGIGRFGTTGAPDVVLRPDGTIVLLKGSQVLLGVETHPSPKFDFYVYGGNEYYQRTSYSARVGATTVRTGWGSVFNNLTGCNVEVSSTFGVPTCSANNRDVWEVSPGFWHRFWRGKEGTLQYGTQYMYIHRRAWVGNTGAAPQPIGIENIIMGSFRYYLP